MLRPPTMESYVTIGDDLFFLRHSEIDANRPTLLLVHGLGASGLSFLEVFEHPFASSMNVLVPDQLGFGRSAMAQDGDYRLEAQADRLLALLDHFGLQKVNLVGHSMGGDIATLLCAKQVQALPDRAPQIQQLINVEGNLTQHDTRISGNAVRADDKGDFNHWFHDFFTERFVYQTLGHENISNRRYYASVRFCRPEAFIAAARDMVELNHCLEGPYKSRIGQIYCALELPKIFCYGTKSLVERTHRYVEERQIESIAFEGASHFVMGDQPDRFYPALFDLIKRSS